MDYGGVIGLAQMAKKYGLLPDPTLETWLRAALYLPELEQDVADYIGLWVIDRISSGYRAKF